MGPEHAQFRQALSMLSSGGPWESPEGPQLLPGPPSHWATSVAQ